MGFPVGYTEVLLPKLFAPALSFLGFIGTFIFSLFRCLGLSDFFETDVYWPETHTCVPECCPSVPAVLIREILPVFKFDDIRVVSNGADDPPESCAVCLVEFEGGEEIRCLKNCTHIFHRSCLDRWMDYDQTTCPLCRMPFVPDEMRDEFNQRLWAASGIDDFFCEYSSITGM